MKIKSLNKKIGHIGWFLVWLKDEDKQIVVKQEKNKVYIWRKETSFDVFIEYLKSKIFSYYLYHLGNNINDFTNDELVKEIDEFSDDIIKTFEQEDYKLMLNISDYKFELSLDFI
jgi:hypothetical protein